MNVAVLQDFTDYLALVDGDKAAALRDCWPAAAAEPAAPSGALTAAEAASASASARGPSTVLAALASCRATGPAARAIHLG